MADKTKALPVSPAHQLFLNCSAHGRRGVRFAKLGTAKQEVQPNSFIQSKSETTYLEPSQSCWEFSMTMSLSTCTLPPQACPMNRKERS
eukprot:1803199-Amphidinium_carterae.2